MLHVLIALLPGIVAYAALIDSRVLFNLLAASLAALAVEAASLRLRGRPITHHICDGSIVVAAALLVLCIPQGLPLWQLILGIVVLCTVGKHLFGGIGHNPFNPAMVGYAFLLVSFPLTMSQWSVSNGWVDRYSSGDVQAPGIMSVDGISGATPLDQLDQLRRVQDVVFIDAETDALPESRPESQPGSQQRLYETPTPKKLSVPLQTDWLWLSLFWFAGGLYLLSKKIISWHIPVSILTTLVLLYTVAPALSEVHFFPVHITLLTGATMLGAFFIATDPVSSAASPLGKLVYGVGIALMCFVVREYSHYPEGFAFAVLLMNTCVPLIDDTMTRTTVLTKGR